MWPVLWAQTPAPGADPFEWVNFGVLGAVLGAVLFGLLWAKPAVDRILKECDRLAAENQRLEDEVLAEARATRLAVEALTVELRRGRRDPAP